MQTSHQIYTTNSQTMVEIEKESISQVITSPVYPMIELWDPLFSQENPTIKQALDNNDGSVAFELMHKELDEVWDEVYRVLCDGGIACINVGDATRKVGNDFQLYSNHSRILKHCMELGFQTLPSILWRKPTNAPNKFMGSGMLPPGAYVTLEHEHILILRKGGKRKFKTEEEKKNRRESAFFWEERNLWFSDIWDIGGISQTLKTENTRDRSAAYPFDLAYRLVNMFSVKKDFILDPFLGTGTTTLAAMAAGRNSIGYEFDPKLKELIYSRVGNIVSFSNKYIEDRLKSHKEFIQKRIKDGKEVKYNNIHYNFPVVTKQEIELNFNKLIQLKQSNTNTFEITYDSNLKHMINFL
ncbi:MAG: DNA-methyltransferase [Candidatus Hodarchaeota archaeon]